MSTLLQSKQRGNKPVSRLYDPGTAKELEGSKWQIRYGDMSSAGGKVYLDKVGISELTVHNQAVEAATQMSASFATGGSMDGLMGLGSGKLNTIKPKGQPTWFENVRSQLAEPLWTCALRRRAPGSFDFGYIDKKKYTGEIAWTTGKQGRGFWDFTVTGFSVGGGPVQPARINAIADTGSSLWYAPPSVVEAYWRSANVTTQDPIQGGYTFPCDKKLPDIVVVIEDRKIKVKGDNMNYQPIGRNMCFGGLQKTMPNMPFSIFGDVFLKGILVIFEQAPGKAQRLGFAQGTF
jgi:aspergillopepsin I